ncbi:uncharacterized protein MELLADRAFT_84517 [Melampsora larici-populina 98AG31]|uniref:Uncharacterized protein n=1 Tax=Melampsora larici-populina (strain 98AG31 / pathotype 3-4-7) TaxID=747676 RepID=F4SCB0_MELLP|nr:uncharacterized protein MELLADRAFT_84517 [Melampsora larici-populina 98AG31]EGF97716.1 hypothetical protein MELLADRAFT_84517 [Melampsora larici-populina 98AG31]
MLPTHHIKEPVCAGGINFKVASITSSAIEITHPFHSPLHMIAKVSDEPDAMFPEHYSLPAGGWTPKKDIQHCNTPLISCYLNTSDKGNGTTQFLVTALVFIKYSEQSQVIKTMCEHEISLDQPPRYNPSFHHHVDLINITGLTTPDWKSAFPETHLLLATQAAQLASIQCGEDLQPSEPSDIIKSQLKPHQKQGLAFLLDRENHYPPAIDHCGNVLTKAPLTSGHTVCVARNSFQQQITRPQLVHRHLYWLMTWDLGKLYKQSL